MCESHREKIQQLWDRLQVPQDEREAFSQHMVTSKKRNLDAVRRCCRLFFLFFVDSCEFQFCGCCFAVLFDLYLSSSVTNRSPASRGAQTAEHPQCHRCHPLWDRCLLGEVLPQHRPAAGFHTIFFWWVFLFVTHSFSLLFSFLNWSWLIVLEDFTEDLLSLHDAEIQRLKQHYEDHKELFEGVQQWEQSWRLFLELEVSLTGSYVHV